MKKLLMTLPFLLLAVSAHATGSYLGVDDQGVSNAPGTTLAIISTQTLNVALTSPVDVSASTVQVTGLGGGAVVVSGSVTADVNASTIGIKGSQGTIIKSTTLSAGGAALAVIDSSKPNLDGKAMVYKSSDAMIVGGTLLLTSLAKSVDLQAISNDCTFSINGGDAINVAKNTAESFDFAYTLTNPSVVLSSKTGNAVCRVRIIGAN